jgi:hypothetical protein
MFRSLPRNILRLLFVYKRRMKRMFRVTSRRGRERICWFANRAESTEGWALDELFTEQEIMPFLELLRRLQWEYRIEERIVPVDPRKLPSWNLVGRLFSLEDREQGMSLRIIGCVEG